MADYERYGGSKEKIGIILSSTDNSKFVIDKATVSISGYPSGVRSSLTGAVQNQPCVIDNKDESASHRVEYVWEVRSSPGSWTAEFSMTLSDGLVVVRAVTITVR